MSNILVDISGNGNNGTITGAISTQDGMKFDGVDDKVERIELAGISKTATYTVSCRVNLTDVTTTQLIWSNGISVSDRNILGLKTGNLAFENWNGSAYTAASSSITTGIHTITCVGVSNTLTLYVDGVLQSGTTVNGEAGNSTSKFNLGSSTIDRFLNGEIYDIRVYNRVLTPTEIQAYHNSFIKTTLKEDFADNGADGINKVPNSWTLTSGAYKVGELAIQQGELVTNGGFDTDTNWIKGAGWTITGGRAVATNVVSYISLSQSCNLSIGKRFRIEFDAVITSGDLHVRVGGNGSVQVTTSGTNVIDLSNIGGTTVLYFLGNNNFNGTIDNVSVTEIPPLPNFSTGTKYLENATAGVISTQSKQAYGEWEWDWYKGADANTPLYYLLSSNTSGQYDSYRIGIGSDERIYLSEFTAGSLGDKFATVASYIAINTWYRLKVARLKSAGVFKDIPTLQTSAMENSATPYTTFASNGRYGFSVTGDGSGTHIAGTADELSITNTYKYLVEFDLQLNSGTAPDVRLANSFGAGTASNNFIAVNGKNSQILTATGTSTDVLQFWNASTVTDYTISGLTIRRIYDANSFAVFIKGGAFVPDIDTGWTLVSTAGGSGSNPIVDATYTTSNYLVADLDAADRFSNLQITDGVEQ